MYAVQLMDLTSSNITSGLDLLMLMSVATQQPVEHNLTKWILTSSD